MPEIGTSGSMSGDGKRGVAEWPKLPRPSSTLPKASGKADMVEPGGRATAHPLRTSAFVVAFGLCVQPVSATPLVVYRPAFRSPRSFADVD